MINKCRDEMDRTVQKIDSSLIDLSHNPYLSKVLYLSEQPTYGSQNAILIYDLNRELSKYAMLSDLDSDLVLYMNQADLVFSGNTIVYGMDRFYDFSVSYENYTYDEFKAEILQNCQFHRVIGNIEITEKRGINNPAAYSTSRGMLYVNSLPVVGSKNQILGTAVFHINDSITDILGKVPISAYGCTYITDEDQNILTGVFGSKSGFSDEHLLLPDAEGNFYQKINGQKMLISYVKSAYNGWIYISMSPMNQIMDDLHALLISIIVIIVLVLFVGIVMALVLSSRNSKPFELALLELQKKNIGTETGTIASLNKGIGSIISDNVELNKTLAKQNAIMKTSFFNRLLHGDFADEEAITTNANYLGIDLSGRSYGVLILTFGWNKIPVNSETLFERDIIQIFTEKISLQQISQKTFVHTISTDRICVLFCLEQADQQQIDTMLMQELQQLIQETQYKLSAFVHCALGSFYHKLSDICISFSEACITADYVKNDPAGQDILSYQMISRERNGYFYSNEIEAKLKNLVESGNLEGVMETLQYLKTENFQNRHVSNYVAFYLFTNLYTSLAKISQDLKLNWYANSLFKLKLETLDYEAEMNRIIDAYREVTILTNGKPKNNNLIRQIETYINDHFSNNDMSLAMMAVQFNLSESYFSLYFKNNVGQIFSKYLETLRINKACDLIKNTNLNIDEIAAKVGYHSTLSFRRAFKKVLGITPSSYR